MSVEGGVVWDSENGWEGEGGTVEPEMEKLGESEREKSESVGEDPSVVLVDKEGRKDQEEEEEVEVESEDEKRNEEGAGADEAEEQAPVDDSKAQIAKCEQFNLDVIREIAEKVVEGVVNTAMAANDVGAPVEQEETSNMPDPRPSIETFDTEISQEEEARDASVEATEPNEWVVEEPCDEDLDSPSFELETRRDAAATAYSIASYVLCCFCFSTSSQSIA